MRRWRRYIGLSDSNHKSGGVYITHESLEKGMYLVDGEDGKKSICSKKLFEDLGEEEKPTGIPTFDGSVRGEHISINQCGIKNAAYKGKTPYDLGVSLSQPDTDGSYIYIKRKQVDGDLPQGTKLDQGKLKPTLLLDDMPLAINEILKVLQFGAEKYSEGNWLKVPNGIDRYRNAADRHRLAIDELDDESGMMHLAHEATSVLMLLELKLREKRDAE